MKPGGEHAVQLKTAQFHYIMIMILLGNLSGQAIADIAGKAYIDTGFLQ